MRKFFVISCIVATTALFAYSYSARAVETDDSPQVEKSLIADAESLADNVPDYWLGIKCLPVSPHLRKHLHLSENQGFVVEEVIPNGPAAKAGLTESDVILKADGKALAEFTDLVKSVNAANGKEIKLDIIHQGEAKTLSITPEKRPAEFVEPTATPDIDADADTVQKWFDQMRRGGRFQLVRPGVILPSSPSLNTPLPGNMSISINKSGDKPADIIVTLDKERWQVTEKDIDKLPEKVQPYVKQMLGSTSINTPSGRGGRFAPEVIQPNMQDMENKVERRIEEMNRRMERMHQELRRWQRGDRTPDLDKLPEKAPAEKSPSDKSGISPADKSVKPADQPANPSIPTPPSAPTQGEM